MIKKILKYTAVLFSAVTFASCVQETPADPYFGIEGDHVNYSVDYEAVTKSNAQRFTVRSNSPWEIVPTEEYEWIKPFPASGEGDGYFCFIIDANNSTQGREAVYTLLVNGETQPTVFTVTQGPRGEFIKASEHSFTLGFTPTTLELKVERNVEMELYALSDDSGADASWITLASDQPEAEDSLFVNVAESDLLQPRTAVVALRMKGDPSVADTLTIFQAGTQELYGFPAVWRFQGRNAEEPYKINWEVKNSVPADEGLGSFSYVLVEPFEDKNNKFTRVIGGTGDPYVTGAWPGDYWLYEVPAVVPANTLFNISYMARVSGTGHKFWMLEYLDGEEWKPVGTVFTTEETGETVEYTNAMQNANAPVGGSFKVKNAMTSLKVRYRCMANWQSSGAGALGARNGGTSRMTGDDGAELRIEVLGTNVGDVANVAMSAQHVALEGAAGSEGSFTFTSSEAWALTSDANWIEFSPARGNPNEETTVTVKALTANETGALRTAELVLNAGMSTIKVAVIQGAAGSVLDPFVSICEGNFLEATYEEKTYNYGIQANVPYTVTADVDWITILPSTRALVEVTPLDFILSRNNDADERTGHITIANEELGLEAVLTVTQGTFSPLYCEWLFNADTMNDPNTGYAVTFGGLEPGSHYTEAGDGGFYINSNVAGNGKITYVQVDKTTLDTEGKVSRYVGSTGHPIITGAWPGDYWLFEATDGMEYPAGTKLNISFITRISGTGQKYWMLEYWDGETWQPAEGVEETVVNGETISYNLIVSTNSKANSEVDVTWTLAKPCTEMQFRYRCVANWNAKDVALDAPNGGTNRIAGAVGTSPVFKVVR
ncbi:MAG: BACON domain-containing protein [Bacteroidales bacterium]|nr:BACON domain-containing protein [Bacteroidales bacterium]MBQ9722618.1 BACON domain-containing protein [Bacteroidales bacterium]